MDTLAGNAWFSKLDANSAYYQVKIKAGDRKKTAFTTKYGLYEFVRMGFGLCNAPATFSRAMDLILRGINWQTVLAFLDDVVVLGRSSKDHLANLEEVLGRFEKFGLKLKPKKCVLFQERVEFLGREVSANRVHLREEHIRAVRQWPTPRKTRQVEQFLGLANYHRAFIKDYAAIAVPLYRITGKQPFHWGIDQQHAFEEIKDRLTEAPILTMPNSRDSFILDTDASNDAIGAELLQVQGGEERVVSYGSCALTSEQRRYCVTRRELLGVVKFTRQYRHYLLGKPFVVRTDHSSLTWLLHFKHPQGQLARWMEELSQYDMRLEHRPGKKHANADALSRVPLAEPLCEEYRLGFSLQHLPCGGCGYCSKAHQNWAAFGEVVDNIIPLAGRAAIVGVSPELEPKAGIGRTHAVICTSPLEAGAAMEEPAAKTVRLRPVGVADGLPLPEDRVRVEQEADPTLKALSKWLKDQQEPDEATIMLWGPEEKFLWINRTQFTRVEGAICKNGEDQGLLLLVPRSLREEVMYAGHDLPAAGHPGRDRTKSYIRAKYFWYKMGQDVAEYVRTCQACNQNKKTTRYGKSPMRNYHAGAPMERVHLDFLGPLPKSSRGNEHILMMVDQFTKWVECIPLPSQTAEETARAAVGEFFCRFGYPFAVFTDQGRNFESKLFKGVCKVLLIHKAKTTPYRPSGNGQVERYNRTLMDAVRCYVGRNQNEWDEYLPQISGALRATVNRNTGYTANRLMLGREVNQPAHLMYPLPRGNLTLDREEYLSKLVKATQAAHEAARANLQSAQKRMKRDYDVHSFRRQFNEGDPVYVLDTAQVKGRCKKLSSPWKGPGRVVKRLTPDLYRVELRKSISTVHQDRLKPCRDRELPEWCRESRRVDPETLFCICRQPYDETRFMIGCDGCEDWFHGDCVGVTPSESTHIDKYYCPLCAERRKR